MSRFQCSECWKKYTFDEYMQLKKILIDPADTKYGYTSVCTCGKEFHKANWRLISKIDDYEVSTVHTEMAQISNINFNDDPEGDYYFETMIFNPQGKPLTFQMRYKTKEEAREGHDQTVEMLPLIILNPNKYPKSIMSMIGLISGDL